MGYLSNLTFKEKLFLIFFVPLFALKLLNIEGGNIYFMAIAVVCFFVILINSEKYRFTESQKTNVRIMLISSAILVLTCGKTGIFFSAVMIFAMSGIDFNEKLYKKLFYVAVIFFLLACYKNRNGEEAIRYINDEWVSMTKRDNLLFVAYAAVVALYLLTFRRKGVKWVEILCLICVTYAFFLYGGSRTGLASVMILCLSLMFFKFKTIVNSQVIKMLCICVPALLMVFCVVTACEYGKYDSLEMLNYMQQGRVYQNWYYLNHYDITLFGQRIIESAEDYKNDFQNLDCAYIDMIVSQGIFFSLFWIVFTGKVISFFWAKRRYVEVSIVLMYAFYGIAETFLVNCFLNMSLFLYGEYIYRKKSHSSLISYKQP